MSAEVSTERVTFACPEDMLDDARAVLAGAYDVPGLEFARPPRVLDIGANVGAFAVWASHRWPGADVTCYEPNPEARSWLVRNVPVDSIRPVAVRDPLVSLVASLGAGKLRLGKHNMGEASFYDLGEQSEERIDVTVASVDDLPPCHVLKVDTEGCEVEILRSYMPRMANAMRLPFAVCFEYHRAGDRVELDESLRGHGYILAQGRIVGPTRGTLCYARVA